MQGLFIVLFAATLCLQLQPANTWQGLCKCSPASDLACLYDGGANQMLHSKLSHSIYILYARYCNLLVFHFHLCAVCEDGQEHCECEHNSCWCETGYESSGDKKTCRGILNYMCDVQIDMLVI